MARTACREIASRSNRGESLRAAQGLPATVLDSDGSIDLGKA